ncbi:hypothetical protein DPX16_13946 [Anabarilius grahami]|uniref:Uncharacterized protein n=1 Tax=Anabarilius grahami TaxID=495550 RepID=A0A3N0Y8I6_ANAGA|nr:hypothetical protein DPX16_13946 [Anabarilius grahami]
MHWMPCWRMYSLNSRVLKKRVDELELAMTGCDSRLEDVERICEELRSVNTFLCAKVNDLEGRSRRLNLKFVGIKEGAEQGHPTTFITELIAMLFGQDKFPKPVKVDRAHRSLRPKPSDDERPRPIIAKLDQIVVWSLGVVSRVCSCYMFLGLDFSSLFPVTCFLVGSFSGFHPRITRHCFTDTLHQSRLIGSLIAHRGPCVTTLLLCLLCLTCD